MPVSGHGGVPNRIPIPAGGHGKSPTSALTVWGAGQGGFRDTKLPSFALPRHDPDGVMADPKSILAVGAGIDGQEAMT